MNRHRARPRGALLAAGLVLAAGPLAGCSEQEPAAAPAVEEAPPVDAFRGVPDARLPAVARAAAYAPAAAPVVAVTHWDEVRERLGVPSLTSVSDVEDRALFWEQAAGSAAVLTPSRIHAEDARLLADYGFTADDVDWEAAFSGPGGEGFVLALRPDVALAGVRRAVADGVAGLDGARLLAEDRVVAGGGALPGIDGSWRKNPSVAAVLRGVARESEPESVYLHRGCVPLEVALGPGAGPDAAARISTRHDLDDLDPVDVFGIAFGDLAATARLGVDRLDLFKRGDLAADWPPGGAPSYPEAFGAEPVGDPRTGRLGLLLDDAAAAGALTLREVVPYAVCPVEG